MARTPLLAFVSLCFGSDIDRTVEHFSMDMLELNTVYDRECKPVFVQVIAWRYMEEDRGRRHNWGWRMVSSQQDLPIRCGGTWTVTVYEGKRVIKVSAPYLRRSWTQTDPEREDSRDWWRGEPPNVFQTQLVESR